MATEHSVDDTYVLGQGHETGFKASAGALETLTDASIQAHHADPKSHLHAPADAEHGHSWVARHFHTDGLNKHLQALEKRHHMGNYVKDRQTGEKTWESMSIYVRIGMHLLYYGSEQEKLVQGKRTLELLKEQSEKMGREYDAPESKAHIEPFMKSFGLQDTMSEMLEPDPDKYPTFNAFFAREIKPKARPVDEPDNDAVTSSPADCRLTVFPTIDAATKYWIKGFGFTTRRLVGENEQLAAQMDGGSIAIARLAPQDYHRWHSPVSGVVENVQEIPGAYYTVNPQAINEPGTMDVFCENRRSVMTIKRDGNGAPIVVVAVGAMLVGSIKYNEGVQVGAHVTRGQCLGAFYYGGSTVIVLYPKGEVVFDADLVKTSVEDDMETLMKVGWRVGVRE